MGHYSFATIVTSNDIALFNIFKQFYKRLYSLPLYVITNQLNDNQIALIQSNRFTHTISIDEKIEDHDHFIIKALNILKDHVDDCIFIDLHYFIIRPIDHLYSIDKPVMFTQVNKYRKYDLDIRIIKFNGKRDTEILKRLYDSTLMKNDAAINAMLTSLKHDFMVIDDKMMHKPAFKRIYHPSEDLIKSIIEDNNNTFVIDYSGESPALLCGTNIDNGVTNFFTFSSTRSHKHLVSGCGAFIGSTLYHLRNKLNKKAAVYYEDSAFAIMHSNNLAKFDARHESYLCRTDVEDVIIGGDYYHSILESLYRLMGDFKLTIVINHPIYELEYYIEKSMIHGDCIKEFNLPLQKHYYDAMSLQPHNPYILEKKFTTLIESVAHLYLLSINNCFSFIRRHEKIKYDIIVVDMSQDLVTYLSDMHKIKPNQYLTKPNCDIHSFVNHYAMLHMPKLNEIYYDMLRLHSLTNKNTISNHI